MFRLKFERQSRGLSQHAVALAARVQQENLSCFERGRMVPSREELQRLAAVFNVPPEELLKEIAIAESRP